MMRRYRWWWIATVGGFIAVSLLHTQPWASRIWAALLLVPIPIAAARQMTLVGDPLVLSRASIYASSAVSLWAMALITAIAARLSGLTAADLGLIGLPSLQIVVWSIALTGAGLAVIVAGRALGIKESAMLRRLLPVTRRERAGFALLSVSAGTCEEFVFRGFLLHVLHVVSGSVLLAGVVAAAVFAFMHAYQEPRGATRAGMLGALLTLPVVLSGSILPSIIAHTAIDILGGVVLQRRLAPEMA